MPQPINYDEIIDRLTEKTEQGKIRWSQVYSANSFTATLDGEFTFRVGRIIASPGQTFFDLSMTDKENNEIFRVEEEVTFMGLGKKLQNLHEAARRIALNVDDKINAVKDILGRI